MSEERELKISEPMGTTSNKGLERFCVKRNFIILPFS
jgi:hypothetical protein